MAALPTLRQLRYLVTLADTLNFTRAAQACFVGQSTLSAGLKELESVLDARLVERDAQHVRMTPLGELVVARARQMLAQAEDLTRLAADMRDPLAGAWRLGVIPTIAPFLLPAALPAMRERHPALRIALREDTTDRLLAALTAGAIDVALIALPYETGGLLVRRLFDDELWLVGPRGDPAMKAANPLADARLADRLLWLAEGHCLTRHTLTACGLDQRPHAGASRGTVGETADGADLEATSLLTLMQMVEYGFGLALIPEIAIRARLLERTGLVARPLAEPSPRRVIALAARATTTRHEAFDALADALASLHEARARAVTSPLGRRASRLADSKSA